MDPQNLETASLYINNQLLSRGLLRHGQTIDFAHPDGDESGLDGSMGRIMIVINDLILRRDRDAVQRESLATTTCTLRADAQRLNTEVERLREGKNEAARKLAIAEAEKKVFEGKLKASEGKERALKTEVERLKSVVGQVRAMCAMECRKRERMLEGLKKTVSESGRTRGGVKNSGVREVVVVGGVGEAQHATASISVDAEGYDLHSETNHFLTELARGLSEDNEHLACLLRQTLDTLKSLSGWDRPPQSSVGAVELGVESLASELEFVIEHIRTLLTNPSFVPLEEVEVRENEILRLRKGWEHMEQRWRDAVDMMDGWRKRMIRGGETVNVEELKMGLRLGSSNSFADKPSSYQLSTVREEGAEEDEAHIDIEMNEDSQLRETISEPDLEEDEFDSDSSLFQEKCLDEDFDDDDDDDGDNDGDANNDEELAFKEFEEKESIFYQASSASSNSAPPVLPLCETTGNRSSTQLPSAVEQSVSSPVVQENPTELKSTSLSSNLSVEAGLARSRSTPSSQACSQRKPSTPLSKADTTDFLTIPHTNKSYNSLSIPKPSVNRRTHHSPVKASAQKLCIAQPRSSTRPTSLQRPASATHPPSTTKRTAWAVPRHVCVEATPKLRLGPDCRLPRPREIPPLQSPLTMASIAAKLAASEREANAARVRAKLKAARSERKATPATTRRPLPKNEALEKKPSCKSLTSTMRIASGQGKDDDQSLPISGESYYDKPDSPPQTEAAPLNTAGVAPASHEGQTRKRKARAAGQRGFAEANRRRSTLTPWELEGLIRGQAVIEG